MIAAENWTRTETFLYSSDRVTADLRDTPEGPRVIVEVAPDTRLTVRNPVVLREFILKLVTAAAELEHARETWQVAS